jgi:hypothetical protein
MANKPMRRIKQFKDYERIHAKLLGTAKLSEAEAVKATELMQAHDYYWPHKGQYQQWSQVEVIHAVYEAEDYDTWQKARVSLKGLSTVDKLYRLWEMWEVEVVHHPSVHQRLIWKCRIENYLSALIRGGQLSRELKVLR